MPDSTLGRVRAHEGAHADQCRRDGAIWQFVRRLAPRQRLDAEAEAYCREARYGADHGGRPRLTMARALDELREEPWFRRLSSAEIAAAVDQACPDLVIAAEQDELTWRRQRHRFSPPPATQ